MLTYRILGLMALLLLALSAVACTALKTSYQLPTTHPPIFEMAEKRVFCVRCHGPRKGDFNFEKYNHTAYFTDNHRLLAYQDEQVCALCHAPSFCNDCHATRVELKPSLRHQTETDRRMQHRGDYLSRHRFDGRMDPSSCFRCHGNPKSSKTCRPCHG